MHPLTHRDCIRFAHTEAWTGALDEALSISDAHWSPHFNQGRHNGGWQGVALRASEQSPVPLAPGEFQNDLYRDEKWLTQSPNLRDLVQQIRCELKTVRLLRLMPGGEIMEHRDAGVCLTDGEARLHCVLQTDESVYFYLNGQRVPMRQGEWWYLDVSRFHRVINRSHIPRLHLVVDCVPNEWLTQQLQAGDSGLPWPCDDGPQVHFERFSAHVCKDTELQRKLLPIMAPEAFIEAVVQLGRDSGFDFGPAEVQSSMNTLHRAWIEQWIL